MLKNNLEVKLKQWRGNNLVLITANVIILTIIILSLFYYVNLETTSSMIVNEFLVNCRPLGTNSEINLNVNFNGSDHNTKVNFKTKSVKYGLILNDLMSVDDCVSLIEGNNDGYSLWMSPIVDDFNWVFTGSLFKGINNSHTFMQYPQFKDNQKFSDFEAFPKLSLSCSEEIFYSIDNDSGFIWTSMLSNCSGLFYNDPRPYTNLIKPKVKEAVLTKTIKLEWACPSFINFKQEFLYQGACSIPLMLKDIRSLCQMAELKQRPYLCDQVIKKTWLEVISLSYSVSSIGLYILTIVISSLYVRKVEFSDIQMSDSNSKNKIDVK